MMCQTPEHSGDRTEIWGKHGNYKRRGAVCAVSVYSGDDIAPGMELYLPQKLCGRLILDLQTALPAR